MGKAENEIEIYLDDRVKAAGGFTRKYTSPSARGVPDRIIFLKGAHFVEVKAPNKTLDPAQEREIKRMDIQGVDVTVVDSKEKIDDLIYILQFNRTPPRRG